MPGHQADAWNPNAIQKRHCMQRGLEKKGVGNTAWMDGFTEKKRSTLVKVGLKILFLGDKTSVMVEI